MPALDNSKGPGSGVQGILGAMNGFTSVEGLGVSDIISLDISCSPDVVNASISPLFCCDVSEFVGFKVLLPVSSGKVGCLVSGCIVRVGLSDTTGDIGGVSGIIVTVSCIAAAAS
jgi:hypothetical protein